MMTLRRLILAALLTLGLTALAYPADIYDWSTTAADNDDADSTIGWAEGQTPGSVNNSARAMMKRVAELLDDLGGVGTVGGTANAITVTSAQGALAAGKLIAFKAGSANTSTVTLNVNSLGAKAVRLPGDLALSGGEIKANGIYIARYDTAYDSGSGAWVLLSWTPGVGQHTIWVPAGAMIPSTTSGAAVGLAETSTNDVMVSTLDFDASSEEFAQFMVQMPASWDEGTLIFQYVWTHGATVTNFGVAFGAECTAFANDDALDTAWGTEVAVVDTGGTTDDVYISPESTAVTPAGSPGAEELMACRITRVVGNGSDTMAVDAKLIGAKVHYTVNAENDN